MLVKLFGAAVQGIDATIVTIEVNCSRGIKFTWWDFRTLLSTRATNVSYPLYK